MFAVFKWCFGAFATAFVAFVLVAGSASTAAGAEAERVEERLPTAVPRPDPAVPREHPPALADMPDFPAFQLTAVHIEGMTVFDTRHAESCLSQFIGKTVDGAILGNLVQCVTQLYRSEGYFLSRAIVPPQEVVGGQLKLHVIEGYIGAVAPSELDQRDANAHFAEALDQRPTKLQTFERALLLLADRPGYRVAASQLLADPQDPRRFVLKLKVIRSPLSYRIFGDNRGSEAHGPEQVYVAVAWNSVFGQADRVAASLFTAPTSTRELSYAEFNYGAAWCAGALWSEFGVSFSRSEDGSIPKHLATRTDVDRFYARLGTPLIRSRAQSLWAAVAFDARETEESDPNIFDADESTRTLRATLTYVATDPLGRTDVNLELVQGLDAFGASHNDDLRLTRIDGRPQFIKLRIDAAHLQRLASQWSLLFSAAAQIADGALVSSEEFGAGGARFGRGYDYSEITGDSAVAGTVELRHGWSSVFGAAVALQAYAFLDAAQVWNRTLIPFLEEDDLSSTGGGIRVTPAAGVTATLEVAKPLSRDVTLQGDRDARFFVSFSAAW